MIHKRLVIASAVSSVLVIAFYTWIALRASAFETTADSDFYRSLVQGWRQGHLYMAREPDPAMLKLPNPYDPEQNQPFRLGDASYYRGHYYLYYGAAPAFTLMLPYASVTGSYLSTGTAVWAFCIIGFLAQIGIWMFLRSRYFETSRLSTAVIGILTIGFGSYALALIKRPMMWELPTASAYAFSMGAYLTICLGLHRERCAALFGIAGCLVGLAVGSLPTWALAIPIIVLPLWVLKSERREWLAAACAFSLTCVLFLSVLAGYNYMRFGKFTEFGQSYVTNMYNRKSLRFKLEYVPHNIRVYFLQPPRLSSEFPFIHRTPSGLARPDADWGEPVAALLLTLPSLCFIALLPTAMESRSYEARRRLKVIIVAMAMATFAVGTPALLAQAAMERYIAHFAPTVQLLSGVGWLAFERQGDMRGWGGLARRILAAAGILTVSVGTLLAFG